LRVTPAGAASRPACTNACADAPSADGTVGNIGEARRKSRKIFTMRKFHLTYKERRASRAASCPNCARRSSGGRPFAIWKGIWLPSPPSPSPITTRGWPRKASTSSRSRAYSIERSSDQPRAAYQTIDCRSHSTLSRFGSKGEELSLSKSLPLCPRNRTSAVHFVTSQKCHKPTWGHSRFASGSATSRAPSGLVLACSFITSSAHYGSISMRIGRTPRPGS
jgi:hypothetical protein